MTRLRSPLGRFLVAMTIGLAALFVRVWAFGEVFSPADLLFDRYPWAHDAPRIAPSNPSRSDEALYHQPMMITHFARLRRGDLPDLDPSMLSGVPAFFQGLDVGRAVSPFSLPFYLFAPDIAVTLYGPLRLFVAGLGMFLFLRRLDLGPWASTAGGLAFAFNGGFLAWLSAPMPTVAAVLPLAWLFADRLASDGRVADMLALGAVLGVQFLGGYLPTSIAVVSATGAYFLARLLERRVWRAAPLACGSFVVALAVGAAALVPMLGNLVTSAAIGRQMRTHTPPWPNLLTFVLGDFWGNPSRGTWWFSGDGNYPEFVTYLGVVAFMLAGVGLVRRRGTDAAWRRWPFVALGTFAVGVMYGVPPANAIGLLPGFAQMNPLRWNVVLAGCVAVLAAVGVDAVEGREDRRGVVRAVGVTLAIGGVVGSLLWLARPLVQAAGQQALAWAQVKRFGAFGMATLAVLCWSAWRAHARPEVDPSALSAGSRRRDGLGALRAAWTTEPLPAAILCLLLATDLIGAGFGFNPTLPRDRVYPTTPAMTYLEEHGGDARIAPVGSGADLPEGHVWSVYGLSTVTGFDYHGSADYQRFMARATGRPPQPPTWDYVGIPDDAVLDLPLLGLLGTRFIVTPPLDVHTAGRGFTTVGELTSGRHLRQELTARHDGLRRIDVLAATYGRLNTGTLSLRVVDDAQRVVVERRVDARAVGDIDWIRLEFAPQIPSAGRRYVVEIDAADAPSGQAITLWSTPADPGPGHALTVDGRPSDAQLWFRSFATAPTRWPGAELVYARDLNIYRNPRALPRAWFVARIESRPLASHLDALTDPAFDPRRTAVVDESQDGRGSADGEGDAGISADARVTTVDVSEPDVRRIFVEAPAGGFLVVGERHAAGWRARVDGRSVPLLRVDDLILGLRVPAGGRRVELVYEAPWLRAALDASAIAVLGTVVALLALSRRSTPATTV